MPNDDMNQREQYNALFLCTGNSARSIMAECLLERIGGIRFRAFSAGSFPAGAVNPYALEILERRNHRTDYLRSKDWDEFAAPGAPVMDFVFTVCDRAAGEVCPIWPGQPMSAHWGFPDPAAVEGQETVIRAAFADVYREIATRIEIFASLPLESLDGLSLKRKLDAIGASTLHRRVARAGLPAFPGYPCGLFRCLPHVSRRVTVRLNTGVRCVWFPASAAK